MRLDTRTHMEKRLHVSHFTDTFMPFLVDFRAAETLVWECILDWTAGHFIATLYMLVIAVAV